MKRLAVVVSLLIVLLLLLARHRADRIAPETATSDHRERQHTLRAKLERAKAVPRLRSTSDPDRNPDRDPDAEPSDVMEIDKRHPGFLAAYQRATTTDSFRIMDRCRTVVVRNDPTDVRTRDYTLVERYEPDGSGNLVLARSDVVPETDDDFGYYECIGEQRMKAHFVIPFATAAGLTLYDEERAVGMALTPESVAESLQSLDEQLGWMARDDPYLGGVQLGKELFECYRDEGTDPASRIGCLESVGTP